MLVLNHQQLLVFHSVGIGVPGYHHQTEQIYYDLLFVCVRVEQVIRREIMRQTRQVRPIAGCHFPRHFSFCATFVTAAQTAGLCKSCILTSKPETAPLTWQLHWTSKIKAAFPACYICHICILDLASHAWPLWGETYFACIVWIFLCSIFDTSERNVWGVPVFFVAPLTYGISLSPPPAYCFAPNTVQFDSRAASMSCGVTRLGKVNTNTNTNTITNTNTEGNQYVLGCDTLGQAQ